MTPEASPIVSAPPVAQRPRLRTLLLQGLADFLLYLLAMLIAGLLLAAPIYLLPSATSRREVPPLAGSLFYCLVVLAAFAVAVYRITRARRAGVPVILPDARPSPGWWRWVLLGLAVVAAASIANSLILHALGASAGQHPLTQLIRLASGPSLLATIFLIVLLGPASEELLFRGCIFGRFRAYGHWVSGAIFSAALFAGLHPIPTLLPAYFCLGFVLAWIVHRTGSLWPSMVLHALNNAIGMIVIRTWTH